MGCVRSQGVRRGAAAGVVIALLIGLATVWADGPEQEAKPPAKPPAEKAPAKPPVEKVPASRPAPKEEEKPPLWELKEPVEREDGLTRMRPNSLLPRLDMDFSLVPNLRNEEVLTQFRPGYVPKQPALRPVDLGREYRTPMYPWMWNPLRPDLQNGRLYRPDPLMGSGPLTSTIYANPIAPSALPRSSAWGAPGGLDLRRPLTSEDLGLRAAPFLLAPWKYSLRPHIAPLQIVPFPGAAKGYSY